MEIKHTFGFVVSVARIVKHFTKLVNTFHKTWSKNLAEDPARFEELENAAVALGREVAGLLTVLVLSDPKVSQGLERAAGAIARDNADRVREKYSCWRQVKLVSGHTVEMKVRYFGPRKGKGKAKTKRGREGAGMYPEFAALGICEGASPALQSQAGWLGTQLPSFKKTQEGLERQGVSLSESAVRNILLTLALMTLNARHAELETWREALASGKPLPPGNEFKGKRIAVAVDGGRLKVRTNKRGKRGKKRRPHYHSEWREPKLLVIYLIDDAGRIDRSTPTFVDGTLLGPDHLMELLAFRLYMLGAMEAKRIVFLGDGADWIWDRVDKVIELARLPRTRCVKVLDMAHAMSNIHTALETVKGWSLEVRKREAKKLRNHLLRGNVKAVIEYLDRLKPKGDKEEIAGRIRYLKERKHLLKYAYCKRHRLPMGSGAVESAIRRVINLRLKGPGIHWTKKMAEGLLCMRAQVLTGRWAEHLKKLHDMGKRSRERNYEWTPTPMSCKADQNA